MTITNFISKLSVLLNVMLHAHNPGTQDAEAGGF
jgi:hypothetical protein